MNTKPISKGDLVMLVHCCTSDGPFGAVFEVSGFMDCNITHCVLCGGKHTGKMAVATAPYAKTRAGPCNSAMVNWLIRLDPDALKDDAPTEEKLTV